MELVNHIKTQQFLHNKLIYSLTKTEITINFNLNKLNNKLNKINRSN